MQVAVLTLDGFNELDSFVAAAILNRLRPHGWAAHITAPTEEVTSMNGVVVRRQRPLEFVEEADAVLIGSGIRTRGFAADANLLERIRLDPARQLIAAQCSGTLLLARLGLVGDLPACTDLTTKPWVVEAGVTVIDAPFAAHGNVATAGGCLAAPYLAAWIIARGASLGHAREALHYVAPVGEKATFVEHALAIVARSIGMPAHVADDSSSSADLTDGIGQRSSAQSAIVYLDGQALFVGNDDRSGPQDLATGDRHRHDRGA